MSIRPIFAWYDFWVGAFYDKGKRRLYLFPIPMFGVVIQFPQPKWPLDYMPKPGGAAMSEYDQLIWPSLQTDPHPTSWFVFETKEGSGFAVTDGIGDPLVTCVDRGSAEAVLEVARAAARRLTESGVRAAQAGIAQARADKLLALLTRCRNEGELPDELMEAINNLTPREIPEVPKYESGILEGETGCVLIVPFDEEEQR